MGTCPKCNEAVIGVHAKSISITIAGETRDGAAYYCTRFGAVLSVEQDQAALLERLLELIKKALASSDQAAAV